MALFGLSCRNVSGLGLAALGGTLIHRGVTGHCKAFEKLGFDTSHPRPADVSVRAGSGRKIEKSVTINRPAQEIYQFWRNFENLPRFMHNIESVKNLGNNRSHWVANGPLGKTLEWEAEIITERDNELIGWRSLPGAQIDTAGSVHFTPAPGNRGTEVKVVMKYDPPGGKVGAAIAWMYGQAADQVVAEDLRRLKRAMEAGELPTTAGQPSGRGRDDWQQTGLMVLENRVSKGLGYFSVGLGLAEVLMPQQMGELIGVGPEKRSMLPLLGLREIASGIGILTNQRPTAWVWSRVAGDAMDLAFLGSALRSPGSDPLRIAAAGTAVRGVTLADLARSLELSRSTREASGRMDTNGIRRSGF